MRASTALSPPSKSRPQTLSSSCSRLSARPLVAHEAVQQLKLPWRELHRLARDRAYARRGVESYRPADHRARPGPAAPYERLGLRQQDGEGKGLCHIVVAAERVAAQHVPLRAERREKEYRHIVRAPYRLADCKAVQPRHEYVEQNGVIIVVAQQVKRLRAVPGQVAVQAMPGEIVAHDVAQTLFILHNEHAAHVNPSLGPRIAHTCVGIMTAELLTDVNASVKLSLQT